MKSFFIKTATLVLAAAMLLLLVSCKGTSTAELSAQEANAIRAADELCGTWQGVKGDYDGVLFEHDDFIKYREGETYKLEFKADGSVVYTRPSVVNNSFRWDIEDGEYVFSTGSAVITFEDGLLLLTYPTSTIYFEKTASAVTQTTQAVSENP